MKILSKSLIASAVIGMSVSTQAFAIGAAWDVDLSPANGFGGQTDSWALNAPGSLYAEWNVFGGLTDSTPDVGSFGNATTTLTEATGTGFLTGGGNIYNAVISSVFDLDIGNITPVAEATRTISLRIALVGSDLDPASVLLDGLTPNVANVAYEAAAPQGGSEKEWVFIWNSVSDAANYHFDFGASAAHMSLDQVAFNASPAAVVPIPAAAWLFGSALLGMFGAGRRKELLAKFTGRTA